MNNAKIVEFLKLKISGRGMKYTFLAKQTGIEYQRLMRIFNQGALITGSELLVISRVLEVDQEELKKLAEEPVSVA